MLIKGNKACSPNVVGADKELPLWRSKVAATFCPGIFGLEALDMHFPSNSLYHQYTSESHRFQTPSKHPAAACKVKVLEQKASAGVHLPFAVCKPDETH